jgi:hypothetical protein
MENEAPAGSGASSDFWRSGRWKEVPERPPLKDLFALQLDPLPAPSAGYAPGNQCLTHKNSF